jgi:hypothetical protein
MEENEMNELNQIRERFLADTRRHFFASNIPQETQVPHRQNIETCRSALHNAHFGSRCA